MNSNVCCMCMCMYIQDYIRQSIKNIQLLRKFRKNLQFQKNDQDSKLRNSNIFNEKETNKPLRYFQEITIKYICTYRCILIYIFFFKFFQNLQQCLQSRRWDELGQRSTSFSRFGLCVWKSSKRLGHKRIGEACGKFPATQIFVRPFEILSQFDA